MKKKDNPMNFDINEMVEEAIKLIGKDDDEIDIMSDKITTILDGKSLKTCITTLSLALAEILINSAPNLQFAGKGANLSAVIVSLLIARAASEDDPDGGEVHTLQ